MASRRTFWWTRADGSYGTVLAADIQEARSKKPNAKVHTKAPFSWMETGVQRSRKPATRKRTTLRRKKSATKSARTSRRSATGRQRKDRRPAGTVKEEASETLSEQDAIAMAHKLLAQWGVAGYTVVFSTGARMHRSLGVCDFRRRQIRFSRLIWPRAPKADRRIVVIHEVAHAVVHDRNPRASAHGAEWRQQMQAMGIRSPDATHSVDVAGLLAGKRRDVVVVLCCGRKVDITIRRLRKHGGTRATCKCKDGTREPLSFATSADETKYLEYGRVAANPVRIRVCGGC